MQSGENQTSGPPLSRHQLSVYVGGKVRLCTPMDRELEIGRGRSDEPEPFARVAYPAIDRVVVADRSDAAISRTHLRLVPEAGDAFRVTNISRNCLVSVQPGRDLMPGKSCHVRGEVRLQLGRVTLVVGSNRRQAEMISLTTPQPIVETLTTLTAMSAAGLDRNRLDSDRPDGSVPDGTGLNENRKRSSLVAELGSSFDDEQGEHLMIWLRRIAKLFYSAANNDRIFADALQAVDEIIGLDRVTIVSRHAGHWHRIETNVPSSIKNVELSDAHVETLQRLAVWKQTVLHLPKQLPSDDASDVVPALAVAPVFAANGEVIGGLLGERLPSDGATVPPTITRLEASLIELIASGLPSDRFQGSRFRS